MEYSTLRKISFIAGCSLFILVIASFLYFNGFDIDKYLFRFGANTLPFSVMSLFAGALMIFGIKATDAQTTLRRSIISGSLGGIVWLFLIISFFVAPNLLNLHEGLYFANCALLCVAASALIFFAFKYSVTE